MAAETWTLGTGKVAKPPPQDDDEEAVKWAAAQERGQQSRYDQVRTSVLSQMKGSLPQEEVDPRRSVSIDQTEERIGIRLLADNRTEDDNQQFVQGMRDRISRLDVTVPTVEVRYKDLTVEARAQVASRSLPTLINVARNTVESWLAMVGLHITKKIDVAILKNVSGIIKPGSLTLLLGPPSSGKTTLLLALAGRLAKNLKVSGEVTYNGHELNEFVPQKTSTYISQVDVHAAEMTVRETLDFSARCQGVGHEYKLLTELVGRAKKSTSPPSPHVPVDSMKEEEEEATGLVSDFVLRMLGLDICADTLVGDQMRRGISGGQKKRLTTGEMIVGPMTTLFMDEISTGLDSATTFQIVKCFRDLTHILNNTLLVSLLQPAPETYNLFDDIILLSEGQIVYHGPRDTVLEFFEACGYKCPERKGAADFLQEVTSMKDQEQYWADKGQPYRYTSVSDFSNAYEKFRVGQTMAGELATPYDKRKGHPAALTFQKYSLSTKELFMATFERESLLMKRNSFLYIFKAFQISIMALIAVSVFFRTTMRRRDLADAQVFAGALFFGVLNIMFNGFSELAVTMIQLPVFYKQRDLNCFPPWAFSLSKVIHSLPISAVECLLWTVLTYYTIGFAAPPSRFFGQLLLLFSVHQMSRALFRFIAGLCRTMIIASTGGSAALLVIFVLGGFIVPRPNIKPWWIWAYWLSPLSYAQTGVNINEFLDPVWQKYVGDNRNHTLGVQFLLNSGLSPQGYWYWVSVGVLLGYALLFNVAFTLVITYLDPPGGPQAIVDTEDEQESLMPPMMESSKTNRGSDQSSPKRESASGQSISNAVRRKSMISNASDWDSLEVVDEKSGEVRRGMVLPFEPLAISFADVGYSVDMPKEMEALGGQSANKRLQLLRGITGAFRPGVLTALVGVTGAGKSTFMDVLAGRKTNGYIEGDIRIAGFPKQHSTFARISGYCEQNDVHSPRVTVHESLTYSAWLRLPAEIGEETRRMFVLQVMDLVELTPLRNAIVGLPGVSGLSIEQRKRLTIAVELVANPSIIFMDEPTSGLDARAAAIVMRAVRNTVDTGRTVVCTIHQPSIDIFEAFDELLLLKRGGQAIYAGSLGRHSRALVQYFQAIPGVPHITEGYNPATWMMEITSPAVEHRLGVDFAALYNKSALSEQNRAMVQELSVPAADATDLWYPTKFSQPMFTQILACLWKQNLTYWRAPDYNNVRAVFTVASALLFGSIFWQMGKERDHQSSLFSLMGAMFAAALFVGVNNCTTIQPLVFAERTVFYRERAAGMYSAIPYAIAQVLIEIPYCVGQTLVYAIITYYMMALEWTVVKFCWYIFFMFCTFLYFSYYGLMAVGLCPNHQIAAVVSASFFSLFNLFSGFLVSKTRLPAWWIWYYWINPVAWTIYGFVASQFGDLSTVVLHQEDGTDTYVKEFVEDTFGIKHSLLPVAAMAIVVFPLLFAAVFMVSIKILNFQKR